MSNTSFHARAGKRSASWGTLVVNAWIVHVHVHVHRCDPHAVFPAAGITSSLHVSGACYHVNGLPVQT